MIALSFLARSGGGVHLHFNPCDLPGLDLHFLREVFIPIGLHIQTIGAWNDDGGREIGGTGFQEVVLHVTVGLLFGHEGLESKGVFLVRSFEGDPVDPHQLIIFRLEEGHLHAHRF